MSSEHAPILQMKGIEKHFGSVIALAGVSVDVYPGECHCLLGDNGAGKSTFIKTMSGVHKPTAGEIIFEGRPMDFADPRDAIAAGNLFRRSAKFWQAKAMFLMLFRHELRRAASRACWIAGSKSATKMPMMAITTSSSTRVKPRLF